MMIGEFIKGVIPAMVTPLTNTDTLNVPALKKLTHYLVDGKVHGLFVTGSQGEFWALTTEEKQKAWEVVVEETNKRIPVYAGTAAVTTREAVDLTKRAEAVGADAVSVLTPFFINPTDDELFDHYKAIAECTKLPVILYGNPARTNVKISPNLVKRLAVIENIVGIKDSSANMELAMQYIQAVPENFSVLMGRDTLIYAALMHGAKGAIAATGNVVPGLVASIYEKFIAGDFAGAKQAQEDLAPLRLAFTWGSFPVVIKEALDLMGFEAGPGRAPVGAMSQEKREQLAEILKVMKVL